MGLSAPGGRAPRGTALKTIIRNARVLTMDAADTEYPTATVHVEDGLITAVEPKSALEGAAGVVDPGAPAATTTGRGTSGVREIDATGHLLMPGLVNAHFHSSVNHLKGSLDSLPLEIFMLYESPSHGATVEPRAAYVRTMLGALEMLKSGVTAVLDDAFFVPAPSPELIDAVMQAYEDCGIRAVLALDQPNVPELDKLPYLRDLLPPALRAQAAAAPPMDAAGLLACYQHLIERWHDRDNGRLRAAVSCSAPQRVTTEYFRALDDLSSRYGLPFYIHVLETKLQRVFGEECLGGRSLIRYVHDEGFLSDRLNIIHGVWLDETDMDLIAAAGCVLAHNPISNLRLGSGIMPFQKLRARGIPLCLGTDESIADDAVNMWSVAKLTGLIHNISAPDYQLWPKAADVLDCLIRGGARAMRAPRPIGQIAVGQQADLILVDLDTLAFTPLNDLRRQLVYCENGSSVRMTMVAGKIVYEQGAVTGIDEPALRSEARELAARQRSANEAAQDVAREWLPYYREMYLRAASRDVGMWRWAGDGRTP
ncbi:MAG TPA: amidohydrolase family protein [Steroidobacteraceae bacterium]|nr:amidohydrolase family protein [Steroidobacteraceae bacterium]